MRLGLIAAFFFWGLSVWSAPAELPAQFKGWFEGALKGDTPVPTEVRNPARARHYVFITGYNNEIIPGYFEQNLKALREFLGTDAELEVIHTLSDRGLTDNIKAIDSRLDVILAKAKHPLVVVGHSRGGNHAVIWALRHATEVSKRVQAVIAVNGAFGGCLITDYFLGENTDVGKLSWAEWAGFKAWAVPGVAATPHLRPGYRALTTRVNAAFWPGFLASHNDVSEAVGRKVFYVQTSTAPVNMVGILKPAGDFIQQTGDNDGMILLPDQRLKDFGTTLLTAEADHHDLVQRPPAARSGEVVRRSFAYALLRLAGLPMEPHR